MSRCTETGVPGTIPEMIAAGTYPASPPATVFRDAPEQALP
jgi:hypothetical protein